MTKLIYKLTTKQSKETVHKRNPNFPFEILPKERKTLQFSNSAIEKYLPTFDNARHIKIPFKVPLKSHLKGLKLTMSKATKIKYFILWYWLQNRYHTLTLGRFKPACYKSKNCI